MRIAVPISLIVLASVVTLAHTSPQEEGDLGTEWEAPEDAKAKPNPLPSTAEVLAEGSALYKKNCEMCHGVAGKGDGPAYVEGVRLEVQHDNGTKEWKKLFQRLKKDGPVRDRWSGPFENKKSKKSKKK